MNNLEIAGTSLLMRSPKGQEFNVKLSVKAPEYVDNIWKCKVIFFGLPHSSSTICGEDSLQSLTLALAFMRSRLKNLLDSDWKIIHLPDKDGQDESFSIVAYFGSSI